MKKSLFFSFGLIGEIGFSTAVPLVVLGLLGRYLDRRFSTSPIFLLIGIALATIMVFFQIKKIIKRAVEELSK